MNSNTSCLSLYTVECCDRQAATSVMGGGVLVILLVAVVLDVLTLVICRLWWLR